MYLTITFHSKKSPAPRAFLLSAKDAVLGKRYTLSVAFVGAREMQRLNKKYRGVDAPTDVLSFALSADAGEMLLCASEARRRAAFFARPCSNFLRFLFIHGLVHLKGMTHGDTMEKQEIRFRKKFGI